jgi:hypothetical protein
MQLAASAILALGYGFRTADSRLPDECGTFFIIMADQP